MATRILVIRMGRTGDIVMITAALNAMLKSYPEAKIDILTSPDGNRILKDFNPRVSVRYVHERKSIFQLWNRRKIRRRIKEQNYQEVFCFELNPSASYFFNHITAHVHQGKLKSKMENYASLCPETVTGENELDSVHEWVWLPVTEQGENNSRKLLASQDIDDDIMVIGFHPSFSGLKKNKFRSKGSRFVKAWPAENFGKLAIKLTEYAESHGLKLTVIMDLLPEDRVLGDEIVKASQGIIKLFIPDLNFERYKATLTRMHLLVVSDTGPMHIAGAVGTNLVALFGSIPPEDSGAYVPKEQREFIHLGKGKNNTVAAIPVETVYQSCLRFL